ncbi:MAG: hypothetical protein K8T25_21260 [Planctomycetia bacterium]|nr:hypothetical protein [Planctomycetia bacterium]
MPIEFRCDQCQTLLRVADDAAGRQARCPKCSKLLAVPEQSDVVTATLADGAAPGAPPALNPYGSPHAGALTLSPIRFEVGEMLTRAWNLYTDNISNCLLAALAMFGTMLGGIVVAILVGAVLGGLLIASMKDAAIIPIWLMMLPLGFLGACIFIWMELGMTVFCLKLARGESAQVSEIFARRQCFWTFMGVTLALGLMWVIGFSMCVVPGVLLMLIYFPAPFLVIDRNLGFGEAFSAAAELTRGKRGDIFLLALVSVGVSFVASFIPMVGGVIVIPLNKLLFVMGYLQLTGQPTAGAKVR